MNWVALVHKLLLSAPILRSRTTSIIIMSTPPMGYKKGFYLRQEEKPYEQRSALTPTTVEKLVRAGFEIHIERNPPQSDRHPGRIFADEEFEKLRDRLAKENDKYKDKIVMRAAYQWKALNKNGIYGMPVLGLKELDSETYFNDHVHIHFAHCFKKQDGWKDILKRIDLKGALLYDLEFLTDDAHNRVAAFGYYAGYAGAAAALLAYYRRNHSAQLKLSSYPNDDTLKEAIADRVRNTGKKLTDLKAIVVGASGRCGSGAVALLTEAGVPPENITKWGREETKKEGPYEEILRNDIFINCIYLKKTKGKKNELLFLTDKFIKRHGGPDRCLKVIADVSCDPKSKDNPIKLDKYDRDTKLSDAVLSIEYKGQPDLSIIAIDHLPTVLPREASEAYSKNLVEKALLNFPERETNPVWKRAEELYRKKLADAKTSKSKRRMSRFLGLFSHSKNQGV